jgi:hypothetical protein
MLMLRFIACSLSEKIGLGVVDPLFLNSWGRSVCELTEFDEFKFGVRALFSSSQHQLLDK